MTFDVSGKIYSKHYQRIKKAIQIKPKSIFHYTSASALLSILQTKKLWFSNIKFLNDEMENKHIFLILQEYIKNPNLKYDKSFKKEIDQLCNTLLDSSNTFSYDLFGENNLYVASFSLKPDQLNLWNYYTKNPDQVGYNIEFDPTKLIRYSYNGMSLKCCGKVIYTKEEQIKIMDPLINDFYKIYIKLKHRIEIDMLIQELTSILCQFSIFFKANDFAQEEEYRMVWETSKKAKIRECRNFFISYIEYALPIISIKSIMISPTQKDKIVEIGLKELLYNYIKEEGFEPIEVKHSKIPIRY